MNIYLLLIYIFNKALNFFNFRFFLNLIKYIRLVISLFIPERKASSEILRGSVLKITYTVDDKDFIALLPYSPIEKDWTKVTAEDDPESNDSEVNNESKIKEKIITEEIIRIAGPGKDFFNLPITPHMINKNYKSITFHYKRRSNNRKFSKDDVIAGLH